VDVEEQLVTAMETNLALRLGLSLSQSVRREVAPQPVRVQYSAISRSDTPLPEGLRPAFLLANRTGSLLVGDFVFGHRSDLERATAASLDFIQRVAATLPVDENDERMVDTLVAKRTAASSTRSLRRREGTSR
jgi:hypothetical protein